MPNHNVSFHAQHPRILLIIGRPKAELRLIKNIMGRRLLFVEADETLIDPEAVGTHKTQLLDIMQAFKKRKMEYNACNVVLYGSADSTTASACGASVGGESDDDFVPSLAWEVTPAPPPTAHTSDVHGGCTEED